MKILFVTSTRIGDAVLSTAILRYLIEKYPSASLSVACGPLPSSLFEPIPGVERVITIHKKAFSIHWISLWARTVTQSWDLIVDLRSSAIAFSLRAKSRKILRSDKKTSGLHRVKELASLFNLDAPPAPKLWVSNSMEEIGQKLIPNCSPIIGLGVTANWMPKVWPSKNFIELIQRLTREGNIFCGKRFAVFGATNERDIAMPVIQGLPDTECINLIGKASISSVTACIKRCSFFIGNDSGLMHIAAALGVPTIGLFGPSPAQRYGPWGEHCQSVVSSESYHTLNGKKDFDHRSSTNLMNGLSVDAVEKATCDLFDRIKGSASG